MNGRVKAKFLLLCGLLTACGGGEPSTSGPGPALGTPPNASTSSVSGLLLFPGALPPVSGKAFSGTEAASVPLNLLSLKSWWLSPQEVLARQRQLGVTNDGVIPGEYIVKRRAGVAVSQSLKAVGVTLKLKSGMGMPDVGVYTVQDGTLSTLTMQNVVRTLSARPDVEYAEPNRWVHAFATPDDKLYPLQWDSPAMNLPAAWDLTKGKAVAVGVVDSGIVRHPDLVANILPGLNLISDPVTGEVNLTDPTDQGGTEYHGSHVAGTIAAATNNSLGIAGVDWGAKIVPVRALSADGGSIDDIMNGALWAAGYDFTKDHVPLNAHPVKVINMSVGGPGPCSNYEQEVLDYLSQQGVIVVIAAGNENQDASNSSPANCQNVVTVGATGPDGTRAPYSNFGARIDVMAPGGDSTQKIKVGATDLPGGILSTVADDSAPGSYAYAFLEGTSMAAPHVAGLVALLKGEQPDLTVAQVVARLKATSTPLSAAACRVAAGCGAGLVNAAAALKGAVAPGPGPTPPTSPPAPPPPPTSVGSIQTYVAALYSLPQGGFDANLSQISALTARSLREGYQLSKLTAGDYQVAAWQDLNGDEEVSAGEPFGLYVNPLTGTPGVTIDTVSRTIIGIDVQLKPVTTLASPGSAPNLSLGVLQRELERQVKAGAANYRVRL